MYNKFLLNRSLSLPITLQLYRRSNPSTSVKIDKIVLNSVEQHEPLNRNLFSIDRPYSSSNKQYNSHVPKTILMNIDPKQSLLMSPIDRKISDQSDGSESGVGSESNPYSDGDQDNRLVCF